MGLEADRRRQQGRPARCAAGLRSINATFDLFDKLGATDEQLDFPVVYASALNGWTPDASAGRAQRRPAAAVRRDPVSMCRARRRCRGPLQLQICSLDYSSYVGASASAASTRARCAPAMDVLVMQGRTARRTHRRRGADQPGADLRGPGAQAGRRSRSRRHRADQRHRGHRHRRARCTDLDDPVPLPMLKVDEPTLTMNFCVNTSPLAGREGKFVTSRQICATGSSASCRATSRCASRRPTRTASSRSRAAANCT